MLVVRETIGGFKFQARHPIVKLKAPLNVMRFDDSACRLVGGNLLSLTEERELILDSGSYGERSTGSARLPGALVKDFALTLQRHLLWS